MGMSASQARLLSITTRLNNNEFRAQTITNSKLRLADKSTEASQAYMDALNSQKLVYNYYNDNGETTQLNMTAGLIYTYAPLKNQYALVNTAGKVLVSAKDAENFENSANLEEFLECYNLVEHTSAYYDHEKAMEKYNNDLAKWQEQHDIWKIDYQKWLDSTKSTDLYKLFSSAVGTSDTADGKGASFCYSAALNGDSGCYLHLLNEILDFNGESLEKHEYTASNGKNVLTNAEKGGMFGTYTDDGSSANEIMKKVSEAINEQDADGNYVRFCDGRDDENSSESNILKDKKAKGEKITELDILQSDWIDNGDGSYSKKSLKQKSIDMYYIIANKLIEDKDSMRALLINFTDGDMKKLTIAPPKEPQKPIEPVLEYGSTLNDKDKAQWYVNLWYMMNGSETANIVEAIDYNYQYSDNPVDAKQETVFSVENVNKNVKFSHYELFDDNLLNNADWLQFALEHGVLTLSKAEFFDPSVDSGKNPDISSKAITWKSTVYTNAPDFKAVDDETAVAIAEVKYKNAMREIENQDKKYDQDLKKLDTEHTALQTEYESIKGVMDKNVERSFKAFS